MARLYEYATCHSIDELDGIHLEELDLLDVEKKVSK